MINNNISNVFIAMPFLSTYNKIYDTVKDAIEIAGMKSIRVDKENFTGSIISYISKSIFESDFVIAIVNEENGNVYYEIGLAHCQKKPVLILTSDINSLKFDLRDHRAIKYDEDNLSLLKEEIVKTLTSIRNDTENIEDSLSSIFGSSSSFHTKIRNTLKLELNLEEPFEIISKTKIKNGEIAVEVSDFFKNKFRAIIDINGIIRACKKIR